MFTETQESVSLVQHVMGLAHDRDNRTLERVDGGTRAYKAVHRSF